MKKYKDFFDKAYQNPHLLDLLRSKQFMEICILSKLANNQLNEWINSKTKIGFLLQIY